MTTTTLNLNPIIKLTKQQFYTLCATNPNTKLELNANGELIVMSPTGGETSAWNSKLIAALVNWNEQTGLGQTFDSSGGFSLPNGAQRSPDAAWIPLEKWNALTLEEKRGFLPLCPDFVIELLSPSDSWKQGTEKMAEYRENGCRLGWLIEPRNKRVAIYREKQAVEILEAPNLIRSFCQRWQIIEFAVFGSFLREDFGTDSDLDVLVTFAENAKSALLDLVRMEQELENIVGRSVDLIEKRGIECSQNWIRRDEILKTAVPVNLYDNEVA